MNTLYRSKIGETRTYEGWNKEADKFYTSLAIDNDIAIEKPADWWDRWTRTLKLVELKRG